MKQLLIYLIILVILFFVAKKLIHKRMNNYTIDDAKAAILAVKDEYGAAMAQRVEQMYRLETGHFTSDQYKLTGTAGMEAGAWGKYVPAGLPTISLKDPVLGPRNYIVWDPLHFAMFLASYIQKFNGNFAHWNSTDPKRQAVYAARVNSIKPQFV